MKTLGVCVLVVSFFLLFLRSTVVVHASSIVGSWINLNQNIPMTLASHNSLVVNNQLLLLAGSASTGFFGNQVYGSNIINGDSLDIWQNLSSLPDRRIWQSSVLYGDSIYVLGGFLDPVAPKQNVYISKVQPGGILSSWQEVEPLPQPLAQGAAVVANGNIYFAGGINNDVIYSAHIKNDGLLEPWVTAGHLPYPVWGFVMKLSQNKLLIFGGRTPSGDTEKVWSSSLLQDGTIGSWSALPNLPHPIYRGDGAIVGNVMIMAGGINSNQYLDTVYTSFLDGSGNTMAWDPSSASLPIHLCCFSLASWNAHLYLSGGHDGNAYYSTVLSSTVDTQVTPTPTPTPVPIPVTKVILVPGFGASWNQDAILNCKDSGYSGAWSLASYAEKYFQPTIKALESQHWSVHLFAYDWRKPVSSHTTQLRDFIDQQTQPQEQVYLVAHSLGGLISEAFLDNPNNRAKVKKFLAVGSPFLGTSWAYGAWSGGEIWHDNLVYRVAGNLALRRCGKAVNGSFRPVLQTHLPVAQDMLPVFDYLRKDYYTDLLPHSLMAAQNGWLPKDINPTFVQTSVGTLSGTGRQTVDEIFISNPNKKDIQRGDWADGKPWSKRHNAQGDGTILNISSQLAGADNRTISQDHMGLLMSSDGAQSIVRFFTGQPPLSQLRSFSTPTSAAIILLEDATILSAGNTNSSVYTELNPTKGEHFVTVKSAGKSPKASVGLFADDADPVWTDYTISGKQQTIRYVVK